MPWTYIQNTGRLQRPNKSLLAVGYAGFDLGRNNPGLERVHNIGPLPRGRYTIGAARTVAKLGPLAMPLVPDHTNEMFERGGFYIHGNSLLHPKGASHGCIVLDRAYREEISKSEDRDLLVIAV